MYRDAANFKQTFFAKSPDQLAINQEITIEDLGYSLDEFFEQIIGYSYNPDFDHNIITAIGEPGKHRDIYILLNQDFLFLQAKDKIDWLYKKMNVKVWDIANVFSINMHEGVFYYELKNGGFSALYGKDDDQQILFHEHQADMLAEISNIEHLMKLPDPATITTTDTSKYLVAYVKGFADDHNSHTDHYEPFIEESTEGLSPKEQATARYEELRLQPDTYSCNLCLITASTDYF
jgi:hypothetical protein